MQLQKHVAYLLPKKESQSLALHWRRAWGLLNLSVSITEVQELGMILLENLVWNKIYFRLLHPLKCIIEFRV